MAQADNFHSQLVGWSKIILPICGIALLSTLFLFARSSGGPTEVPFAELETLAREQRVNAPQFSGVTDNGSIIVVGAKSAQPDPQNLKKLSATELSLTVDGTDGSSLRIMATEGDVDSEAKQASLHGLARLETSTGYTMETNGLVADLDSGRIQSNGALEIRAPYGRLTAGRVIFETSDDGTGQQMLFTDGVRLVYTPTNDDAKE